MRMTRKQRRAKERRLHMKSGLKTIAAKSARLAATALLMWSSTNSELLYAMPTQGEVVGGSAVISQAGSVMTIQQQTAQAILNWRNFGIAPNEHVQFIQPDSNSVALNRVLGNNASAIYGKLTANGKVFLVNPNGVFFAPGAQVNVGGMVATTLSISDADFMAGRYAFVNQGNAQGVINQGTIIAENQGLVALLAPEVKNEGIIVAKKGTVALAAGDQTLLDFNGDGRVQLAVDPGALRTLAENKGLIEADGGVVLMTARAGQELASSVVNQSGIIRANSLDGKAGAVTLNAVDGTVRMAGTVDVSADGAKGGAVDLFGKEITLTKDARVNASGDQGGGTVRVGGDWQGTGDAPHADKTTIERGAVIQADALTSGSGGKVVVWSDDATRFDGTITAKGGALGGNGGMVETSGHALQVNGNVNASGTKGKGGTWLLDPANVTISSAANTSGGENVNNVSLGDSLTNGTNVTIKTDTAGGKITVNDSVTSKGNATLTLEAHGDIAVNADIRAGAGSKLNVDLHADTDGVGGGTITLAGGKTIATGGGSVLLHGGAGDKGYAINQTNDATPGVNIQGNIQTAGGSITMYGQSTATAAGGSGVAVTGSLDSGGGDIRINGSMSNSVADASSDGVKINGTITAGTGTVSIVGENKGAGNSISTGSAAKVTAKKVELTGDKIAFDSAARIAGDSTLTIKQLTDGKNISIGTNDAGSLSLAGNLFSGDAASVFKGFSSTVIGDADKTGTLTANGGVFDNDVTLQTKGKIAVTGTLNAGAHNVTLQAGAASGGSGVITAGGLDLQGSVRFTLDGANQVDIFAGNVQGADFKNAKSFAVGTVGKTLTIADDSTLTATSGDVMIAKNIVKNGAADKTLTINAENGSIGVSPNAAVKANQGNLNVGFNAKNNVVLDQAALNSNGGKIDLTAQTGAIELKNLAQVNSGAGDISFHAKNLSAAVAADGTVSGKGKLTIDTYDQAGTIGIGIGGGAGDLQIATTAFDQVFKPGFSEVVIGREGGTGTINVGKLTVQDKLTVQSGGASGKIIFANGADLRTNNKALTLNASAVDFGTSSILEAGSGDLTITSDTITNWGNVDFSKATGGKLFISSKTNGQAMQIGGSGANNTLSITGDGFTQIGAGQFDNVTIGRESSRGTVNIDTFTLPSNLTIIGGAGTFGAGTVTVKGGKTLTLQLNSLTQTNGAIFDVENLLLSGGDSSAFDLSSAGNAIGNIAANVGSLKLYNGSLLNISAINGVNGINATGNVELVTDRIKVDQNVASGGILTINPLTNGKTIQLGGTDDGASLWLSPDMVKKLSGQKIIFGGAWYSGPIYVYSATFNSNTEFTTTGKVGFGGAVNIGSGGSKKLTINAADVDILSGSADLKVKDLTWNVDSGLTDLNGLKITGSGDFGIENDKDIYISNGVSHAGGYDIYYDTLNKVFTGFKGFKVQGENITMDSGSLTQSADMIAKNKVTVNGEVKISGKEVNVTANETKLGSTAKIEAGGSFTLSTDKLIADAAAKITGSGALTVQQRTAGTALTINNTGTGNGLVITNAQLNGGLFGNGFSSLTLGNGSLNETVTVDGAQIANDVTIRSGKGGTIAIGSGGLGVDGAHSVTLKGGTINNDGNSISAPDGTINLYADTLTLSGTNKITGKGTLGIGTYDGTKAIYLGNGYTGNLGLMLPDSFFSGVFGTDFTKYSIGNGTQGTIFVKDSTLGKDTTLTAKDINFAGNMNIGGNALTMQATGAVSQTGGVITAGNLALLGKTGNYALGNAFNQITGTLSADAKGIDVKSNQLKIGVIGGNGGNITLTSDTMTFDPGASIQSVGGVLTVQQGNAGSDLSIGTATGGLHLGNDLFDGKVLKDGFKHVYLGREDGVGKVTIGGSLNFVDDTTIRSAQFGSGTVDSPPILAGAGSITMQNGTQITTGGNSLELRAGTFTTEGNTGITTGSGDLTLTVDDLNFASSGSDKTMISGNGQLILQTLTQNRDLYLGSGGANTSLWLKSGYFDGTNSINRVFQDGFSKVILGRADGTGTLYQTGTTNFSDEVVIRQASANSTGSVNVTGTINTGGNDFSVESQKVNIHEAYITTGKGNVSLTANELKIDDKSWFKGEGDLILKTFSKNESINLGGTDTDSGLNLKSRWFTGDSTFKDGFKNIIIGRADGEGTITVKNDFKVTDNLTLQNGTGKITVAGDKTLDLSGNQLTVTTTTGAINVPGKVANVGQLMATTKGSVEFTNTGNTIASIGKIDAGGKVDIKNNGALTITDQVKGTDVSIWTKDGNLTMSTTGNIKSTGNVFLTAEDAHFINQNTGAAKQVIDASGRWVIFTYDSIGDTYGNLTGDFRRYGTNYGDMGSLIGDYGGSGSAHKFRPTATISADKIYGDARDLFFTNGSLNSIIEGWEKRKAADQAFIGGFNSGMADSSKYSLGTGLNAATNVNKNIGGSGNNGTAYGSGNSNANLQASYAGANPLNYDVQVEFWVKPKEVKVSANDFSKIYDGIYYNGGNGVTYDGFVNGQNQSVTNGGIEYGGNSQGALNAGDYSIGLGGNLSADNYTFKYEGGKLTVDKRKITVTVDDAERQYGMKNPTVSGGKVTNGNLVGSDQLGDVTVNLAGSATSTANAGTTHTIAGSGATIENGLASNYDISYVDGTLTITKKEVTVTASSDSKVYDGKGYNGGHGVSYDGFVNGQDQSVITGGNVAYGGNSQGAVNAGGYDIGLGGNLSADNYTFNYVGGKLDVKKKEVTVSASNAYKDYDGKTYWGGNGIQYNGFISGDDASVVTGGSVNYGGTSQGALNAGSYELGLSGNLDSANYTFNYVDGMLVVAPRHITVTINDGNRVYGDANPTTMGGAVTGGMGLVGNDKIGDVNVHVDAAPNANAGTKHDIFGDSANFTSGLASNYEIEYNKGTLTIDKAKLTITADDKSRLQNMQNPAFTVQYDGLKNGESGEAVVNGLQVGTAADVGSPAGKYDITPDGASSSNYEISYVGGTLTVIPSTAIDDVTNITKPKPADPVKGTADAVINKRPEVLPPLMGDVDPNIPAMNVEGMVSIIDVVATADYPKGDLGMQVQGTSGTFRLFANRDGFGMELDGNSDGYDPAHSKTKGAIPVLYTDYKSVGTDHEQTLDGFYAVSYTPDRLSIQPEEQGIEIPHRSEINPDLKQDYGVSYQDAELGSFQVAIGDGIVTIHPKDDQALETVLNAAKAPQRAVLTAGVLRSIRDFNIAPDQLRAIYIFRENMVLGAQARKG